MEKESNKILGMDRDTVLIVGFGAAVAAGLGLAYLAYKSGKTETAEADKPAGTSIRGNPSRESGSTLTPTPAPQKGGQSPQTGGIRKPAPHLQSNASAISIVSNSVKKEKDMYSMRTLTLINEMIEDICMPEFSEMIIRNRNERRRVIDSDPAKYNQIVESEIMETDALMMETIEKIMEKVGGDIEVYKNSIEYWSQQDQRFAMLNMMMIEKMKIGIKTTRDRSKITPQIAKDMMRLQLKLYPQLQIEMENPELEILVKKSMLQDRVFQKFGFEEEDLIVLPSIGQDPEFLKLAQSLQMQIQMDQMKSFGGMGGMMGAF